MRSFSVSHGERLVRRVEALRHRTAGLGRPEHTGDVWRATETFVDLTGAMVRFLEGELDWCPSHGGPIEDETLEILEFLVRFNRAGFLVYTSQPTASGDGWDQIAYVAGFANEGLARRIGRVASTGSLGVVVTEPGATGGRGSYGDLYPFIDEFPTSRWVHDVWGDRLNSQALGELLRSWHVVAFDTNDRDPTRLWRNVLEALEGPPPGLQRLFPV